MSITFDIDEQVVQRAREAAAALGSSVEQLVKAYVEGLAAQSQDNIEQELEELDRLSEEGQESQAVGSSAAGIYRHLKTREPVDLGEPANVAVRAEREGR